MGQLSFHGMMQVWDFCEPVKRPCPPIILNGRIQVQLAMWNTPHIDASLLWAIPRPRSHDFHDIERQRAAHPISILIWSEISSAKISADRFSSHIFYSIAAAGTHWIIAGHFMLWSIGIRWLC
jgi:hypothetical protein